MKKDLAAARDSWFGVSPEIETVARKLCVAAGIDPDYRNPDCGYWSYAIGGRAGPGHQAPKQWVEAEGNPAWLGFYAQAKAFLAPRDSEANPVTQDDKGGFNGNS